MAGVLWVVMDVARRHSATPPAGATLSAVTAKETLLERAPRWSEEQAEAAIEAAQRLERKSGAQKRWDELSARAAALRA